LQITSHHILHFTLLYIKKPYNFFNIIILPKAQSHTRPDPNNQTNSANLSKNPPTSSISDHSQKLKLKRKPDPTQTAKQTQQIQIRTRKQTKSQIIQKTKTQS
jgi:hypothetical protein